jgi:integrase
MRIYRRKGVWYIDYSFNGRRVRKSVGIYKRDAELALKEAELKIVKGEFLGMEEEKKIMFDELSAEYLKFSKANKRPQVFRRDKIMVNNLLEVFGGKDIRNISAYELEQYKMKRRNAVSASTVNREITCICHMFNKATEWHYLVHNKLRVVKKFKEPPGRLRYLKDKEISRLLKACTRHIKSIVIMALNTGMRKSEILNLKWSDIDIDNKVITIRMTKNNEVRAIPINSILYNELKRKEPKTDSEYVFANSEGKPYSDIKTGFKAALRRARIKDFRFHDLRHTFASRLVMAGVDIRTVQELMGHKDIKMTMRYSHLSDAHLKEAIKKLENGTNLAHERGRKI